MITTAQIRGAILLPFLAANLLTFAQGTPAKDAPPTPEAYLTYAMQHDGDAQKGLLHFNDEKRATCFKCHSIDGKGDKAGPDLSALGEKFSRREIIESILHPSALIAVGYATTVVELKSGDLRQGILKQSTPDWLELAIADGSRSRIPISEIKSQAGSSVSLMPEGLQLSLPPQDFTDLVEFLVTLKEPAHSRINQTGMPAEIPELVRQIVLQPVFPDPIPVPRPASLGKPSAQYGVVWFEQIPGRPHEFLALEQSGIVWRVDASSGSVKRSVFLDLSKEVFSARGPNGLLGLAFHPRFKENRTYFLKHQILHEGRLETVLVRRRFSPDFLSDSGQSSQVVLNIPAVAEHHNGGCIRFGPDGYLYFGMGDSAPNHDPQGHGQNLGLLLGKMLRIDVDHQDAGLAYAVPSDNPFRGQAGARAEIWAWGLREPWRFDFDPATGDLWVGDLGQERGDEVAIVRRGENHGWNVYEGFELFSHQHEKPGVKYAQPIFATRRKQGITIIGGHVFHTREPSSFNGVYVFGDYGSRRIWGLTHENRQLKRIRQLALCPQPITAFSRDEAGILYAVGYEGMVYRLDFSTADFNGPSQPARDYSPR